MEHRILRKDGVMRWVMNTLVPSYDAQGKLVSYDGVIRDIHKRKEAENARAKLEAQLRQTQKMEAIGTLAGGIAHDFNNILFAMVGFTELANDDVPEESLARANLDEVLKAGRRAKDLVQQILTFSRQVEHERRPVQVHLIVKEALKLLRASLPTTIEIPQNIDTNCGPIVADLTQIHQVIMNLCTNAYHAMRDEGGVLEVSLSEVDLDSDALSQYPDASPGTYVRLTVSDTGRGMDTEVMERIFDPFFTTKAVGEGTGMGLAVIHGIVKSHGGMISVQSEEGKGSTFHVYLPRLESPVVPEVETTEPIPTGGKERILFVDDEEPLVRMVQQMLERLGYDVTVRTSSVEALEAFRAQPDKFDLIITDQTMPNKTGVQLARDLMRIRPDIPIILCTGFSEVISEKEAKDRGLRGYIMKPVVKSEIAKAIRMVLDK
jgi:signal transduction histidine kinase